MRTAQVSVHLVKMNVTATTLPRKSARFTSAPSCEVSANSGAGAICGSDCRGGIFPAETSSATGKNAIAPRSAIAAARMLNSSARA